MSFRVLRTLPAAALLAAAGCQSQWYLDNEHPELVRTDVVVRTEPPGAVVYLNGRRQAAAPLRIPVEYEHTTQQYFRTTNYGNQIRESTGVLGTILLFPVWIPASFFHTLEEMKRHVYGSNRHTLSARLEGHAAASAEVLLEGQESVDVKLTLAKSGAR